MASTPSGSCYIVVIDTNEYAGNFERELTAFLVGVVGECGVGAELRDDDVGLEFDSIIRFEPDDHGCFRPCSIWLNDEGEYNSVAIYFEDEPTDAQFDLIIDRLGRFKEAPGLSKFLNVDDLEFHSVKLIRYKQETLIIEEKL